MQLCELLSDIGPAFAKGDGDNAQSDRSARAFRLAQRMRAEGATFKEFVAALEADAELAAWKREKGEAQAAASCNAPGNERPTRRLGPNRTSALQLPTLNVRPR